MIAMLKRISIASGLAATMVVSAAPALAQNRASNQQTADAVATALRSVPELRGEQIAIDVKDGVATLSGNVADAEVKSAAIERARYVSGVSTILDGIGVANDGSVMATQYQIARGGMPPGTVVDGSPTTGGSPMMNNGSTMPMMNNGSTMPMMNNGSTMPMMNGGVISDASMGGPLPEGPAGFGGATQASNPGYPNYAWPSYAPHPNFSAVGYPTAYPWQAWPNIGPFYPYPEVPLDWRAVTLRWDDGIWFLDFKKHYTRPFFTPYPFGLFGY